MIRYVLTHGKGENGKTWGGILDLEDETTNMNEDLLYRVIKDVIAVKGETQIHYDVTYTCESTNEDDSLPYDAIIKIADM